MPSDRNQMFADLRTALLANTALAALVGTKITRGLARQGERKPYIVMHHIGGEEIADHGGPEVEGDEHQTIIQFDCIGLTPAQSDEVATALRAALESARETEPSAGGTYFLGFDYDAPFSDAGPSISSTQQGAETIARTIQVVTINHIKHHG